MGGPAVGVGDAVFQIRLGGRPVTAGRPTGQITRSHKRRQFACRGAVGLGPGRRDDRTQLGGLGRLSHHLRGDQAISTEQRFRCLAAARHGGLLGDHVDESPDWTEMTSSGAWQFLINVLSARPARGCPPFGGFPSAPSATTQRASSPRRTKAVATAPVAKSPRRQPNPSAPKPAHRSRDPSLRLCRPRCHDRRRPAQDGHRTGRPRASRL